MGCREDSGRAIWVEGIVPMQGIVDTVSDISFGKRVMFMSSFFMFGPRFFLSPAKTWFREIARYTAKSSSDRTQTVKTHGLLLLIDTTRY